MQQEKKLKKKDLVGYMICLDLIMVYMVTWNNVNIIFKDEIANVERVLS